MAVILTAAIYTAMHTSAFEAGVIAVMNVVMMSVLASLLIIYTESLLAPILLRFIWNGLGGFVLGIVPLENNYPSLWNTVISGNDLISGGSAKLDGSILVLFVNVLLIAFMSFRTKKKARSQPPA